MRRLGTRTAIAGAWAFMSVACNGILGIDAPTLIPGDAGDAPTTHDGAPLPDAGRDAHRDGAPTDATMSDARRDGSSDGGLDVHAPNDSRVDADASGGEDATFDGNCTCTGSSCTPIIVAKVAGGVTSVTTSPTGLCFYAVNDNASPFPGAVGCSTFGGATTTIDPDASAVGAVTTGGVALYWINDGRGQIRTCSLATQTSCVPVDFAPGIGFAGGLAVNATYVYWNVFDGIHACLRSTGCTDATTALPGTASSATFAANSAGLFWGGSGTSILFCPTAGCQDGGSVAASEPSEVQKLAATDQRLFWSNGAGMLMTCSLASGTGACVGAPTVLSAGGAQITRLIADDAGVYFSSEDDDAITRVSLEGSVETVASASGLEAPIAVGPTCVFWGEQDGDAGVLKAIAK